MRLRPAPSGWARLGSSRVSRRSVWALPSNPPMPAADGVERRLAVVPERRVAEVVREAGDVDDVRVAAERRAELAADLGDLEGVRQPVAHEVVAAGLHDLRLGREPAEAGGVHHPRPVAGEVVADRRACGLGPRRPRRSASAWCTSRVTPRRAASAPAAAARCTHGFGWIISAGSGSAHRRAVVDSSAMQVAGLLLLGHDHPVRGKLAVRCGSNLPEGGGGTRVGELCGVVLRRLAVAVSRRSSSGSVFTATFEAGQPLGWSRPSAVSSPTASC